MNDVRYIDVEIDIKCPYVKKWPELSRTKVIHSGKKCTVVVLKDSPF
jgi:protein-disulfide isomerase